MFKDKIAQLLEKEMDRKSFLKHVGLGIVGLTGFSVLLKTFVPTSPPETTHSVVHQGYGASAYGDAESPPLTPIRKR